MLILLGLICGADISFIRPGNVSPTGLCSAGFLCFGGAVIPSPNDNETGILCPTGSYCPAGSFAGIPCPKGTFRYQCDALQYKPTKKKYKIIIKQLKKQNIHCII